MKYKYKFTEWLNENVGIRFVHKDGRGLMNNQSLNYNKLNDDEYLEVEEGYQSLRQPSSDLHKKKVIFVFTPEGEIRHKRLISLLSKASKLGVIRQELPLKNYTIVWDSEDGQLGLIPKLSEMNQNTIGTEEVDFSQIQNIYRSAASAVKLVQLYDKMTNQRLLTNITTIAPISSNVYGLYMSKENRRVLGPGIVDRMKFLFPGDMMMNQKLQSLPLAVIKKYLPDVNPKQLQPTDTIRVNVQKIVAQYGDTAQAIIEIASTIVHEATHELELQNTGKTSEVGPQKAEQHFIQWVKKNWNTISKQIPNLNQPIQ